MVDIIGPAVVLLACLGIIATILISWAGIVNRSTSYVAVAVMALLMGIVGLIIADASASILGAALCIAYSVAWLKTSKR